MILLLVGAAAVAQIDTGADASAQEQAPGDGLPAPTHESDPFVYRLGVLALPSTDNFWEFFGAEPSVWNAYVLGPTKPALFAVDPRTSALVPELAAGPAQPTFDSEGWRVRIELDDEMSWSDGTPVTAGDYVFTFETVRRLDLGGSWQTSYGPALESVHADGRHALRIEFDGRPRLSTWPYGAGMAPIMPKHVWEPVVAGVTSEAELYRLAGDEDVGGGPMQVSLWDDSRVASVPNPGYGPAPFDEVVYELYPEPDALVSGLAAGEIDAMLSPKGLTPEQAATLEGRPGVSLVSSPSNSVRYLGFNLDRVPMADTGFRRAVAHLLDRDSLAEELASGSVANTYVEPANRRWSDPERERANDSLYSGPPAGRVEAAVVAMREAGYEWDSPPRLAADGVIQPGEGLRRDGVPVPAVTLLTSGDAHDPARPAWAEAVTRVVETLGVDVELVETDFQTVVDIAFGAASDQTYDMYLLGLTLGNPALPEFYRPLFASEGAFNNTGYSSEAFEASLVTYETALDLDTAQAALSAMEAQLASELPYLLLYRAPIVEGYRSDRVGYGIDGGLGGIQGRLGGLADVYPTGDGELRSEGG